MEPGPKNLHKKMEDYRGRELERKGRNSSSNLSPANVPDEIILNILLRLLGIPVKSLIRLWLVCKQWCYIMNTPYFINCHLKYCLEHPFDGTGLFISAKSSYTQLHGYFWSSLSGGKATPFSLPNFPYQSKVEHLNGLSLLHSLRNFAYIVNPASHNVLKLPEVVCLSKFSGDNFGICYFFGFEPICNDFKVLNTRVIGSAKQSECWIFSLRNCSWKKVEPLFPTEWLTSSKTSSVCVNGVIFIMLNQSCVIAAFDLREENFSTIALPEAIANIPSGTETTRLNMYSNKFNHPPLLNYNGLLAVVCRKHIWLDNTLEIWILEDYENKVWVMETITVPRIWVDRGTYLPVDVIATGEVMFRHQSEIIFYNMKTKSFRSVDIILPSGFSALSCMSYVQSIWPLRGGY